MNQFLEDVLKGLSAKEKYLESKYFYDSKGDVLFQKIMACSEYYSTRCEMDIFKNKTDSLVNALNADESEFDLIELGAGDATKSVHLLKGLKDAGASFTYYPIDISQHVIGYLQTNLPKQIPGLNIHGLNGEYFSMLQKATALSDRRKVVLFLGSNIGNVSLEQAEVFCKKMRRYLNTGDLALIGFDLKKDPETILKAYDDSTGYTAQFNLNLLHRINDELKGDFVPADFYHYPVYDPQTGACKSFLISKKSQLVNIADMTFSFAEGESIYMEISQKYSLEQIGALALNSGFKPDDVFFDSRKWFVDVIWECV